MVESKNPFFKIFNPLMVLFAYAFLYIPIFILVLFSFNASSKISIRWVGFTLKWYKSLFTSPEILGALKVSLIVALTSTILSVVMGTGLVLATKWWKSRFFDNVFYANIILPDIVLAIGLLSLFSYFKISLGYVSLIAGHTLIGLGFVIPIIKSSFAEIDPILTEASADLGATMSTTFYKVIIPLLGPAIMASALLVFTLSLDDFFIAFFCSGPKIQTLTVYVFTKVREGLDPSINAISSIMLAISSLLVLILSLLKIVDQVATND